MLLRNVKGIIVAPPEIRASYNDKFKILFEAMSRDSGFSIQWTTKPVIPAKTDIVIAYGTPLAQLVGLKRRVKLISMVCDIHTKKSKVKMIKHALWQRADSIWTFEDENFKRDYLRWYHKHVWIPMYFAPHERYVSLPFNNSPKMKCLLSGCSHLPWYPLRNHVNQNADDRLVDKEVTPVPGFEKKGDYPWRYTEDAYAKLLNSYFCCVTGTGNNTMHAKCLEIPAAGSLLLTNMVSDMSKAGFIPKEHYVPITEKDVLAKIAHCVRRPEKFEGIRKAGRMFARQRHSVDNRKKQLMKVIERILNGENLGAVNCEWI